jgi:hypothetical protein
MSVQLYAFTCGTVTGDFGRLMAGGEGDITLPVPVFLIEHPKGRALFDTGLHPDCQHDPEGRLGTRLASLFSIGFDTGEEVSARLEAIGRDPARIDLVINSHSRFDHGGGNARRQPPARRRRRQRPPDLVAPEPHIRRRAGAAQGDPRRSEVGRRAPPPGGPARARPTASLRLKMTDAAFDTVSETRNRANAGIEIPVIRGPTLGRSGAPLVAGMIPAGSSSITSRYPTTTPTRSAAISVRHSSRASTNSQATCGGG